ncbi:rRNA maturation RNAse YbeY, partial [Candidatus Roizmanbacteria bacterium]|nr:rRNA maturation RNAse YbeY [Candidatus Roizmanbacteria bacterium]
HENVALPVLSFPLVEKKAEENLIGEVLICYPQAILLAAQREKKVDDIILELVEHGISNLMK